VTISLEKDHASAVKDLFRKRVVRVCVQAARARTHSKDLKISF